MSPKLLELSGASVERNLLGLCLYSLKKKKKKKKKEQKQTVLPYNNQSKITKEWGKII